ncbi:uncharacterized protein LOC122046922 [Zingiber officinale]|uniref:DUF7755 domain-containing protein n=1 Tax=Zingiber officinale TaxID=94328 RepID=A0A8J5HD42_ZINOF|nr:uncharacterized protein LOC122046922 [Zingiber officinale]XP_042463816.1 uncharacterized protein LOC122046922 [Zingiber officinale]KAG6525561.1 hypothetical protein ZIOFF_015523 [Zingiber officinale]
MEDLILKYLITSTHANPSFAKGYSKNSILEVSNIPNMFPIQWKVNKHMNSSRFATQSKRTPMQDFQGFAKPSRLLQSTEAKHTKYLHEDTLSSLELDLHNSYYIVELCTSSDYGSSLNDINAALLLCLIDENGNAILQRLAVIPMPGVDTNSNESLHFQRGYVDVVTFKGSKLGKIEAIWIGLETGSWRLDGLKLTVVNGPAHLSESIVNKDESGFDCLQYTFESHNLLLGEGGISVAELRPSFSTELSRNSFSSSLNKQSLSQTLPDHKQTREASMKEYAELKFSLLLYDLILILTGSSILNLCSNEKSTYAFLAGGLAGFFYLLLLQKSVDGLSAPANNSKGGDNLLQAFGGIKRQWVPLVLVIATSAVMLKYRMGGTTTLALSPTELFVGISGFLTSKIAVLLAAFKPVQRNQKGE